MKSILIVSAVVAATSFSGFHSAASAAAVVPCEDSLVALNDALAKATLSDTDAKAVADLKAKGEERCKAEDDRRANGFFNDALAIITKK